MNPETYADILTGKNPKIIICLCNHKQLGIMNKTFKEVARTHGKNYLNPLRSYVLFIDECDYQCKPIRGITTKKNDELTITRKYAYREFLVSATIMDSLCQETIRAGNILQIKPSKSYVGPIRLVPKITPEWDGKDDDKYFMDNIMNEFSNRSLNAVWGSSKKQPNIMLYSVTKILNNMDKIMWKIRSKYPNIVVITYNGEGITVSSNYFDNHNKINIEITGLASESSKKAKIYDKYKAHTLESITPGSLLLWMKHNGDAEKWSHIVFISGHLAGRGISYACQDHLATGDSLAYWYLTDQRLRLCSSTCEPNILQILRLCSNLPGVTPRQLWVSESDKKAIALAFHKQENYLELIENMSKNNPDMMVNKSIIESIAMNKNKFTNHKVVNRSTLRPKKIDDDDGTTPYYECCFDYERFVKRREYEEKKLVEFHNEIDKNDKTWGIPKFIKNIKINIKNNKSTIYIKILKYFYDNKLTSVAINTLKQHIKEDRGADMNISHYTKWSQKQKQYTILIVNDRLVSLNPNIIEALDREKLLTAIYSM